MLIKSSFQLTTKTNQVFCALFYPNQGQFHHPPPISKAKVKIHQLSKGHKACAVKTLNPSINHSSGSPFQRSSLHDMITQTDWCITYIYYKLYSICIVQSLISVKSSKYHYQLKPLYNIFRIPSLHAVDLLDGRIRIEYTGQGILCIVYRDHQPMLSVKLKYLSINA